MRAPDASSSDHSDSPGPNRQRNRCGSAIGFDATTVGRPVPASASMSATHQGSVSPPTSRMTWDSARRVMGRAATSAAGRRGSSRPIAWRTRSSTRDRSTAAEGTTVGNLHQPGRLVRERLLPVRCRRCRSSRMSRIEAGGVRAASPSGASSDIYTCPPDPVNAVEDPCAERRLVLAGPRRRAPERPLTLT